VVEVVPPWGYQVSTTTVVTPFPAPVRWNIGPVRAKSIEVLPASGGQPASGNEAVTMQLTADQQVTLTISGEDRYGNPVDISTADAQWSSSDESIVQVFPEGDTCTAVAVGPVGSAAVTVSNPAGDVSGSLAVQVVAGEVTEVVVTASEPTDKPVPEQRRTAR
jgi:hypothetical protein